MAVSRLKRRSALQEFVMRFTPAALALSLLVAVSASVGHGATHDPDPRAAALVAQGRSAADAGDLQAAIDAFESALVIDPAFTGVYLHLADAARQQGLQGKAIHYYREALQREPGNLAAISGEGAAMVEKGAVAKAERNLAQLQSLCGGACAEAEQLAAAIAQGPPVQTAEAALPDSAGVAQN
jgi:tetratricopeptide (TPR) repeat protein